MTFENAETCRILRSVAPDHPSWDVQFFLRNMKNHLLRDAAPQTKKPECSITPIRPSSMAEASRLEAWIRAPPHLLK